MKKTSCCLGSSLKRKQLLVYYRFGVDKGKITVLENLESRHFTIIPHALVGYISNSRLQLARKHARIFVVEHYLFLKAHSFSVADLSENCSHCGTDLLFSHSADKYPSIFSPQMEAIAYLSGTFWVNF